MVKLSEIQVNEEQKTTPEQDFTEEVPIDYAFLMNKTYAFYILIIGSFKSKPLYFLIKPKNNI